MPRDLLAEQSFKREPRDLLAELAEEEAPKPPATWGDTLKSVPTLAYEGGKKAVGGLMQMAGEQPQQLAATVGKAQSLPEQLAAAARVGPMIPGVLLRLLSPDVREMDRPLVDTGKDIASTAQGKIEAATPQDQTFWQRATSTAGVSLGQAIPGTVASVVARSPTPLITSFGAISAGDAYADARAKDIDPGTAQRHAVTSGVLEAGTEYLPAKVLFKAGTVPFKRLVNFMAAELPGENLSELGQMVSERINGLREDITAKEVIDTIALTSASTLLSGGAQSGVASAAHKGADLLQQKMAPRELGRAMLDAVRQGSAPPPAPMADPAQAQQTQDIVNAFAQQAPKEPAGPSPWMTESMPVVPLSKLQIKPPRTKKPAPEPQPNAATTPDTVSRQPRDLLAELPNVEQPPAPPPQSPRPALDAPQSTQQPDNALTDRRVLQRGPDRRQDVETRKRVADMTPDEMRTALFTDELTGLRNRRAYEEAQRLPVQSRIDMDGFKAINDNYGHPSGDEVLRVIARYLDDNKGQNGRTYRIGGDEFPGEFNTESEARAAMESTRQALAKHAFIFDLPDGSQKVFTGVTFSYGIGQTESAAEAALRSDKARRAAEGLRAGHRDISKGNARTAEGKPTQEPKGIENASTESINLSIPSGVSRVDTDEKALQQSEREGVQKLRGQGNQSVPRMAGDVRGVSSRHGAETQSRVDAGQEGQQRSLRTDELSVANETGAGRESSQYPQGDGKRNGTNRPAGKQDFRGTGLNNEIQTSIRHGNETRSGEGVGSVQEKLTVSNAQREDAKRPGVGEGTGDSSQDITRAPAASNASGSGVELEVATTDKSVALYDLDTDVDSAIQRAIDRAIALAQGKDIQPAKQVRVRQRLAGLRSQLESGKLTQDGFIAEVERLHYAMEQAAAERHFKPRPERARGADFVRQKLLEAKRRGDLTDEAADLTEWFIQKNPALLDDLGISVRTAPENAPRARGRYIPPERIIQLFKGKVADTTAVHEILHHFERMMPESMQAAIRREWLKAVTAGRAKAAKANKENLRAFFDNAIEFGISNDLTIAQEMEKALTSGAVPYDHYQYVNPSEFWAVNMERLVSARHAARGSIWARIRQWVTELLQRAKGALGVRSDAPMIRALDALLKSEGGEFQSKKMLGEAREYSARNEAPNESDLPQDVRNDREAARRSKPKTDSTGGTNDIDQWLKEHGGQYDKKRVLGKIKDARPAMLYLLTRRMIAELGADVLPQARTFDEVAQKMDARRNQLLNEGFEQGKSWGDWARQNDKEADKLAALMHDATIHGADPSVAYEALIDRKRAKEKIAIIKQQMRGRSGENTAKWFEEIDKVKQQLAFEKKRAAAHPELQRRFDALPEKAKEIFVEVRDFYQERHKAVMNALLDRIDRTDAKTGEKTKLKDKIRAAFESAEVQGPYFPLARFGDFWVSGKKGRDTVFYMAESSAEQSKYAAALKATGYDVKIGKKLENVKAMHGASESFVADVITILDKTGAPETVKDTVYQLFLTTLPDLSMRKNFIHRKKTAGFSHDALRAFSTQTFHGSYQLARLEYSDQMQKALDDMRKARDQSSDPNKAADVLNELERRYEWIMNPTSKAWANYANSISFAWYMGLAPATAITNMLQTPVVAYPVLASRFGWGKAGKALAEASAQYFRHPAKFETGLPEGEQKMLAELTERGTIDKTQAHDLAAMSETPSAVYSDKRAKVMNVISFLFHHAERFNRQVTALAAYRLARESGMGHDNAVIAADKAVWEAHFDYSSSNRARWMQGDIAKVAFQFKQYPLNMTWMLARNGYLTFKGQSPEVRVIARRKLTGILGMSAIFTGAAGMPIYTMVSAVMNSIYGSDPDEPWDFDTEFRNFLADYLGKDGAHAVAKGPFEAVTDVGTSGRTTIDLVEMFVRSPDRDLEGKALVQHYFEQALGPSVGIVMNWGTAYEFAKDGKTQRAFEYAVPKFMRDAMKAVRYGTEGVQTMRHDVILDDTSFWQETLQAAGFTPGELGWKYDAKRALSNKVSALAERRKDLIDQFMAAKHKQNQDTVQDAKADIRAWNKKHPQKGMQITLDTLMQSAKSRARYSRETVGGAHVPKQMRNVRDDVRYDDEEDDEEEEEDE